ncbi:hypothetical protein FPRO05_12057 [Fusarium proliferatum]|uniref:Uncharacterized protein n=1 Tax=Gibberella intermedia TaxID=948311 RepID=A0A365N506_GIBIN|nr:hypothetical protein FPRO05_12057 [Fusarium proliferatum]
MDTRVDAMDNRIGSVEANLTRRIDNMGSTINQRLNNIDAFIKNVDARARNAQARRLGVQYTPLVKTNGQQIRNFPCTFETVDCLTGMSTRRFFLALFPPVTYCLHLQPHLPAESRRANA